MTFLSRADAGERLGLFLRESGVEADIVLGLPRGGVIVGAEVARVLGVPLDVVVVRKIGHPRHREFAVGALAAGDVVVLDERAIETTGVTRSELEEVIAEEKARLVEYQMKFEHGASPDLAGKRVLLVDDGLATGATAEAAVLSVRQGLGAKVILAVPVASDTARERLSKIADVVIALIVDPAFDAVGRYYEEFSQTTDEEVMEALQRAPR